LNWPGLIGKTPAQEKKEKNSGKGRRSVEGERDPPREESMGGGTKLVHHIKKTEGKREKVGKGYPNLLEISFFISEVLDACASKGGVSGRCGRGLIGKFAAERKGKGAADLQLRGQPHQSVENKKEKTTKSGDLDFYTCG